MQPHPFGLSLSKLGRKQSPRFSSEI